MSGKVCIIGGGGVRTPLLIHGLLQSRNILKISELVLFDVSHERAEVMAALGREIASNLAVDIRLTTTSSLEGALEAWRREPATNARRSKMVLLARKPPGRAAWPWRCEPYRLRCNMPASSN